MISTFQIYRPKSVAKCLEAIAGLPECAEIKLPVQYCSESRYIPASVSDDYGWWNAESVPQIVEPLNAIHPDHPSTHITYWASVQSTKTFSFIENAVLFWIGNKLGSVLMNTASLSLSDVKASSSIEPLIDNSPLKNLIRPMSTRRKRSTGDTANYKEFAGGCKLKMTSYGASGDQVGVTYNLILNDEYDKSPDQIKGVGDTGAVIESRTIAKDTYKIVFTSTTSEMGSSKIAKEYWNGNQQRFFVPCPICGEYQVLVFKIGERKYGLAFDTMIEPDTGRTVMDRNSVRYICRHCEKPFYESQKMQICNRGEWRETWNDPEWNPQGHKPAGKNRYSYHANGLISKYLKWERICQMYFDTDYGKKVTKFKTFVIDILAEEWARVEKQVSFEVLKNRAEPYCLGIVPYSSGVYLLGFVDVQGDRLELGIFAFSYSMEIHIVDHLVFFGDPANLDDRRTWCALHEHIYNHKYKLDHTDIELFVMWCGIDTGYAPNEKDYRGSKKDFSAKDHVVHQFIALRMDKFMAFKGAGERAGVMGLVTQKRIRAGALTVCYHVNTSGVKQLFYSYIGESSGPYSIHVPQKRKYGMIEEQLPDEWYQQILSERYQEIRPGVMGWKKIVERNEMLDLVVGAMAMAISFNIHQFEREWWDEFENETKGIM